MPKKYYTDEQFVEAVRDYWKKHGKAPSYGDIAEKVGCSPMGAYYRLQKLCLMGLLQLHEIPTKRN